MRLFLSGGVGLWQPNRGSDVRTVQELLNRHATASGFTRLRTDGVFGTHTEDALRTYQRTVLKMTFPDGIVSMGSGTFQKLNDDPVFIPQRWKHPSGMPDSSLSHPSERSLRCRTIRV